MVDAVAAIEVAALDGVAPAAKAAVEAAVEADVRGLVAVSGVRLLSAANSEPIAPRALVAIRSRVAMRYGSCCLPTVVRLGR